MNARHIKLKFLLDEGVPNSVGAKLVSLGHEVIYTNTSDVVMRGSPDKLVATAAVANDAILVALDGDMRKIAQGHGYGSKRYKKLSLIKLSCSEPSAATRIEQFMGLIEYEWDCFDEKGNRRIFIEIGDGYFKSNR